MFKTPVDERPWDWSATNEQGQERLSAEAGPERGRGRGCATGCGFAAVGLVSAVVGGLIVSLLLPTLLGVNPIAMLRGEYLRGRGGGSTTTQVGPIRIVTQETTAEPIVAVAQKVTPSVVNISTEAQSMDFFGGQRQVQGTGSGVILTSDGYILTNDHLVSGTDRIFVTIGSQPNVTAKVVGEDPESDLAVIKVDRSGLVPAEFGDSDKLKVGETVVAIGSPFGLEHSVTAGIISALHRAEITGQVAYADLIQTDAAINPGNSGGALVNMRGQVIGINTLIQAQVQQSAGVGFAIPSDFAKKAADQLIKTGKVQHPYLGIRSTSLTGQAAQERDVPISEGALIVGVESGQPAEKAGVRPGDVLVELGGREIRSVEDIFAALREHSVGETIEVVVYRGSRRMGFKVKLAERPTPTP